MSKSCFKIIALGILDSVLNILAGSVIWFLLFLIFPPRADISGASLALCISATVLLSRDIVILILNGLVKLKTYIYNRRATK